ncbi:MAG TPA: hypothetical protein VLH79_11035 [Chthonomonadales bacterium]|nr:hypothetical protein [Chthonomonadales bacterium]
MIVPMCHGAGMVGARGSRCRLPRPSESHGRNRGIACGVNPDDARMTIATRSLLLVATHVPLTDD